MLDTGITILQGDGAGAIDMLGATESTFSDDLRWAEQTARVLDDAEVDIARVRSLLTEADAVARYVPGAGDLVDEEERATFTDVLGSEDVARRLPDLRGALRRVEEAAERRYDASRSRLEEAAGRARARLEAHPDWSRLTDEDRTDLTERLRRAAEPPACDDHSIAALGTLLAAEQELARQAEQLFAEIPRRLPIEPTDGHAVAVDLAGLLPAGDLADQEAVEAWLAQVREALRLQLASGPVRLTVGSAERLLEGIAR